MNLASLKLIMIASLLISITACGGRSKPDRSNQPAAPVESAVEGGPIAPPAEEVDAAKVDPNGEIGTATSAEKTAVPYADENTEYVGDIAQEVEKQKKASSAAPAKDAPKAESKAKKQTSTAGVPAEKAMGWLKNGNARYVKRRVRADGQAAADRKRLLAGQAPHSIVFTCSDSRVPPEIVFDQKLGELYVVRTESLNVDKGVLASLEKGVALGAQLLVVLSHEGCAANAVKDSGGITSQSPALAELEAAGRLMISPASYSLKTGVVKFE